MSLNNEVSETKSSQSIPPDTIRISRNPSPVPTQTSGHLYVLTSKLIRSRPFQAKGRHTGDSAVKPRNPILLIGNAGNPITSLASARNASARCEGSVVLEHGRYGHCTIGCHDSLCTAKAIRNHFVDGVLPEAGTKCEVMWPLVASTFGWDEVLGELAAGDA